MGSIELPAGTLGVDYSFARPDPHALAQAGVRFVCRYLASLPNAKVINPAERDALWAAGLAILLNWEQSSGDFLDPAKGSPQGAEAARQAAALNYPQSLPIVVSCDQAAPEAQWGQAESYFREFKAGAGGYRLGVYGASGLANALLGAGLITFVWAPDATSWNQGTPYRQVDIRQHPNPNASWPSLHAFSTSIDIDVAEQTVSAWVEYGAAHPTQRASGTRGTAASRTYVVEHNDSWWSIAASQLGSGTRDQELAAFNGKTTQSTLHPGDILHIPE